MGTITRKRSPSSSAVKIAIPCGGLPPLHAPPQQSIQIQHIHESTEIKGKKKSPLLRTRTATHVRQNNHLTTRTSNKESSLKSADPLPAARNSAQLNPPLASHGGANWLISGKSNHGSVSRRHSSSPYIHVAFESSRELPLPPRLHHLK